MNSINNFFYLLPTAVTKSIPILGITTGLFSVIQGIYTLKQERVFASLKERSLKIFQTNQTELKTPEQFFQKKELNNKKIRDAALKIFLGLSIIFFSGYLFIQNSQSDNQNQDLSTNDLAEKNRQPEQKVLHPREVEVKRIFGEEALNLDQNDPRPKLIFVAAVEDRNNSLTIEKKIFYEKDGVQAAVDVGINQILAQLNEAHDIQYQVINDPNQICTLIEKGAKKGEVISLFIDAHGNPDSIAFSADKTISLDLHGQIQGIPQDCFTKLSPKAEITLLSCEAGASEDSIASALAKIAKRYVWAPQENLVTPYIQLTSDVPPVVAFLSIKTRKEIEEISNSPIPNYKKNLKIIEKLLFSPLLDMSCKFSPLGHRVCGMYQSKILPSIWKLAYQYFPTLAESFHFNY